MINVTHTYANIVPREVVEEPEDLMNVAVGTGPFKMEKWVPDNYTLLATYEDYYEGGVPYVDVGCYVIMEDESAQMAAIKTGEVHVNDISPEGAQILRGRPGLNVIE